MHSKLPAVSRHALRLFTNRPHSDGNSEHSLRFSQMRSPSSSEIVAYPAHARRTLTSPGAAAQTTRPAPRGAPLRGLGAIEHAHEGKGGGGFQAAIPGSQSQV